jgi:hypothetical protein
MRGRIALNKTYEVTLFDGMRYIERIVPGKLLKEYLRQGWIIVKRFPVKRRGQ